MPLLLIALSIAFVLIGIGRIALLVAKHKLQPELFNKAVQTVQEEEPHLQESLERAERVVFARMALASVTTALFGLLMALSALATYLLSFSHDTGPVGWFLMAIAVLVFVIASARLLIHALHYDRMYRSKCQAQRSQTT
jgi:uncharacterized membrane protein HdeD (DUF308 family)